MNLTRKQVFGSFKGVRVLVLGPMGSSGGGWRGSSPKAGRSWCSR